MKEQQQVFETSTSMKQTYRSLFAEYLKTGNYLHLFTISIRLIAHDELKTKLAKELGSKADQYMTAFNQYINIYKIVEMRTKDIEKTKDEKLKKFYLQERDAIRVKAPLIDVAVLTVFEKLVSYTDLKNIPVQSALVKSQTDNRRPMGFPSEGEFIDMRYEG